MLIHKPIRYLTYRVCLIHQQHEQEDYVGHIVHFFREALDKRTEAHDALTQVRFSNAVVKELLEIEIDMKKHIPYMSSG